MARCVIPDVSGRGSVHIGHTTFKREFVSDSALKIIGTFTTAIYDLPSLFVVVAGDSGRTPFVAVARNFPAVVKIIQHAELQRQLMLVRGNVLPIKSQRGISIAHFQVTEYLVIGAIFFDDIDHVADRIGATSK